MPQNQATVPAVPCGGPALEAFRTGGDDTAPVAEMTVGVWGWRADRCARWFYVGADAAPSCPVCSTLPAAFSDEPGHGNEAQP